MECQVCRRRARPGIALCRFHYHALKRLVDRYPAWSNAAEVDWQEYIKRVDANPVTGAWVKEVIAWSTARQLTQEQLKGMLKSSTAALQGP